MKFFFIKIKITKNNIKFVVISFPENKPLFRISTRNDQVKTKNKISALCVTAMCHCLGQFLETLRGRLFWVYFSGLKQHRKLIGKLISNRIFNNMLFFISDKTQSAHNGCRGVHVPRK